MYALEILRGGHRSATRRGSAVGLVLAFGLALGLAARSVRADEANAAVGEATGALPGLVRVGAATLHETGLVLAATLGYGYLGSVVAEEDTHQRAVFDVAGAWWATHWLAVSARFVERYDRHTGTGTGRDTGMVGDPRAALRLVAPMGGPVRLALQLGAWFPGGDAPSIDGQAISPEALALASWTAAGGAVSLAAQAGARLDRSAASADDADQLSPSDRLALGVSDSSAVLVGAGALWRIGRTELFADWSWDYLVGADAPPTRFSPMRAGAGVRQRIGETLALQIAGELNLARVEAPAPMDALYPIEPRATVLVGLAMAIGVGRGRATDRLVGDGGAVPDRPPPPRTGTVIVQVSAAEGGALEGAEVGLGTRGLTASTGSDGLAVFDHVPVGRARVAVHQTEREDGAAEVTVGAGRTARVQVTLERKLPPGQIRGVIRAFNGKPLAAKLTIQPGDRSTASDEQGEFSIDLPPGEYDVAIDAKGYASQSRHVRIEEGGVTILNVDLRR